MPKHVGPQRLGLRAEECTSGDGLMLAAPARVARAPAPNQLGRRAIRGPVANQRLRGWERLRCIFRPDPPRLASRQLSSLLFELPAWDPATIASACVVLVIVGLGAALMPARRAVRIDPIAALRTD
jgi:hypothetical protein